MLHVHQIWQLLIDIGHLLKIKLSIDSCMMSFLGECTYIYHKQIQVSSSVWHLKLLQEASTCCNIPFTTSRVLKVLLVSNRPVTLN